MATNITQAFNKSEAIKWLITILVPLCVALIPTNDVYTDTMRIFFVITLAGIMLMAFETMNMMVVSLLLPIAYMIFLAPANIVFSGWTVATPYVCVGAMLLANVLTSVGILNRIAYWCIAKCGGSFKMTCYGVLLVGLIISLMTGVMGGLLVCTFAFGVCKAFGMERSKETAIIMMVALFGTATAEMFIYKPVFMSLINSSVQAFIPTFGIKYLDLMLHNWPFLLFCALMIEVYCRLFHAKADVNGKEYFQQKLQELGKTSSAEKKGAVLTAAVVLYMVSSQWTGLPMDYGLMIIPWFAFLPGIKIGSDSDVRLINYEMIFFMMACMGIGAVSSYVGVANLVSVGFAEKLVPYGATVALLVIYVIGVVVNFLMTPMAMLAAFTGPVTQIALSLGVNPLSAVYTFYFACDQIILPYEYANYLLAYSFGVMSMKHFIQLTGTKMIVGTVFLVIIMFPYWKLIGIF